MISKLISGHLFTRDTGDDDILRKTVAQIIMCNMRGHARGDKTHGELSLTYHPAHSSLASCSSLLAALFPAAVFSEKTLKTLCTLLSQHQIAEKKVND